MARIIDSDVCLRLGSAFMCIFFTLAAYVQLNDPDATVWFSSCGRGASLSKELALAAFTALYLMVKWHMIILAAYFIPAVVCFCEASQPQRFHQHAKLRRAAIGVGLLIAAPLMAVSLWGWLKDARCGAANLLVCEYGREAMGSAIVLSWLFVVSGRTAKPSSSRAWLYMVLSLAPMGLWAGLLLGDALAYFCIPVT